MKPRRDGRSFHAVTIETIAAAQAIVPPSRIRGYLAAVLLAHGRHRIGKASPGHGRSVFRIFLAWLTIRRQNDRLALPYRSGAMP